jgi:hypothetical protein
MLRGVPEVALVAHRPVPRLRDRSVPLAEDAVSHAANEAELRGRLIVRAVAMGAAVAAAEHVPQRPHITVGGPGRLRAVPHVRGQQLGGYGARVATRRDAVAERHHRDRRVRARFRAAVWRRLDANQKSHQAERYSPDVFMAEHRHPETMLSPVALRNEGTNWRGALPGVVSQR